ncbi:MAG: alanine racemase [Clostridiaceae bacterium]|nr:alanine racemase [Clostridiaceae bacterium]
MKAYIVERDKLKNNIDIVKKRAAGKPVYGVIKANGYGLGLLQLARVLRDEGIDRFAITEPADATRLRMAGFIDEEILVMRPVVTEADVSDIIDSHAVATIGSYDDAVLLSGLAEKHAEIVEAHIKIDTGMGRYGFFPEETERIAQIYRFMKRINITGLYTHFNCAFGNMKKTEAQLETFLAVADRLREAGCNPGCVHAANSSFLFRGDISRTDAVRVGSAFIGRLPCRIKNNAGLQPVGYARCEVAQVRWLREGQTVGYGAAYTAKKAVRVAVIPFGYADGFGIARTNDIFRFRDKLRYILHDVRQLFSHRRFTVTIRGKRAAVLGHIGMVHCVVDVSAIQCEVGDEAMIDVSPIYANPMIERFYE